jgi:hypothetical protein
MSIYSRALIIFLVVANLTLGTIWLLAGHYKYAGRKVPVSLSQSLTLPSVDLIDDRGRTFNITTLKGKPLFVQFINPLVEAQVTSFEQVFNKANGSAEYLRPLLWLIVTNDAAKLRSRLTVESKDVVIVEHGYVKLRELFSVPSCCEYWFIFDERGILRQNGSYDSGDASSYLTEVATGRKRFSIDLLLSSIREMNSKGYFSDLHRKASQSKAREVVIAMFSSVCTGCADGELVDVLNHHARNNVKVSYLALVPNTFSRTDLINFKTNLDIPFVVERANKRLSQEWAALASQYGAKRANGIVFVISKGEVVSLVQGIKETEDLLNRLDKNGKAN